MMARFVKKKKVKSEEFILSFSRGEVEFLASLVYDMANVGDALGSYKAVTLKHTEHGYGDPDKVTESTLKGRGLKAAKSISNAFEDIALGSWDRFWKPAEVADDK